LSPSHIYKLRLLKGKIPFRVDGLLILKNQKLGP
jgi:hypothetical protein